MDNGSVVTVVQSLGLIVVNLNSVASIVRDFTLIVVRFHFIVVNLNSVVSIVRDFSLIVKK